MLFILSFIIYSHLARFDLLFHFILYSNTNLLCSSVNNLVKIFMGHLLFGRVLQPKIFSSEPIAKLVACENVGL